MNLDTFSDLVLVVDSPDGERRTLLVLEQTYDHYYRLALSVEEIAFCAQCGGMLGDPYNPPQIKSGVLTVSNYGGAADRWYETFTIQFRRGRYELIGYTVGGFSAVDECHATDIDINLLTSKARLRKDVSKGTGCEMNEQWTNWKATFPFYLKARNTWKLPSEANFPKFFTTK
ncbi:hypothetical protein [Leptospira weilii]|uniref:hypothetical protein n=1 Tax=Leptospira weilii TaxID=28184 RepID=UPI0002FFD4CE|nr:hypothetical protein [Leptospira weilii]